MSEPDDEHRPTVDDVDPSALAVNSVEDSVRVAGDASETDTVDAAGETRRVDDLEEPDDEQPNR
ncbi:hypothetical protein [Kribbella sp. HUAS MG21]|uniref:Multidrug transporter n=1 Tax=Kribbella sp. HUAS MG21 TaxID=3160966 RepID=A0AAU7THS2_9ACTN